MKNDQKQYFKGREIMLREECAPGILTCSDEAFRIYNTLCAGSKEEKGEKSKKKRAPFSSRTPAFFLAVAMGIVHDKTGVSKKEKELTRREYITDHTNYKPFEQYIKSKYALKSEFEIVNKMLELQEYGIRELYDEYHKTGKIDFLRIFRDTKARL